MYGMTEASPNFRLRVVSGELAGRWLWTAGLTGHTEEQFRDALPWEDADRHPELYTVHPKFIEDESGAWKSLSLESAQRMQRALKRAGFETQLA
jgi:hypothetical protein